MERIRTAMSEELIQRNLFKAPEKMGPWDFYNIGATTLKALKGAKIIPNRDYAEYEIKKPDALIVKNPRVIAAIEYKQSKELKTKKQIEAAISQEIGTAQVLGAKVYIVTDGQKTFWINPLTGNELQTENGSFVALNFSKDDAECVKLISKVIASISDTNDTILTSAVVDPLPLAQRGMARLMGGFWRDTRKLPVHVRRDFHIQVSERPRCISRITLIQ